MTDKEEKDFWLKVYKKNWSSKKVYEAIGRIYSPRNDDCLICGKKIIDEFTTVLCGEFRDKLKGYKHFLCAK